MARSPPAFRPQPLSLQRGGERQIAGGCCRPSAQSTHSVRKGAMRCCVSAVGGRGRHWAAVGWLVSGSSPGEAVDWLPPLWWTIRFRILGLTKRIAAGGPPNVIPSWLLSPSRPAARASHPIYPPTPETARGGCRFVSVTSHGRLRWVLSLPHRAEIEVCWGLGTWPTGWMTPRIAVMLDIDMDIGFRSASDQPGER